MKAQHAKFKLIVSLICKKALIQLPEKDKERALKELEVTEDKFDLWVAEEVNELERKEARTLSRM